MRLVLAAVVAFAASAAGGAGFVALKDSGATAANAQAAEPSATAPEEIATETMKQDSVEGGGALADQPSPRPQAVRPPAERQSVRSVQSALPSEPRSAVQRDAHAAASALANRPPTTVGAAAADTAEQRAFRQVARILSNMRENDVAQILAHIDDEVVEGILRQLTARDAARLLSELPAERAARLSERLLRPSPEEGGL